MNGGTCASLVAVVDAMQSANVGFALVHESALMGWGLDNNAFLNSVDVLLVDGDGFVEFGCASPTDLGEFAAVDVACVSTRLWSRASLGIAGGVEVTSCPRYGCEALAPEIVLRKLAYSPDARMLLEQRARLASVLLAEELSEKELSMVARYVRGE